MTDTGWSLEEGKGVVDSVCEASSLRTEQIMAFFIELIYLEEGGEANVRSAKQWNS